MKNLGRALLFLVKASLVIAISLFVLWLLGEWAAAGCNPEAYSMGC